MSRWSPNESSDDASAIRRVLAELNQSLQEIEDPRSAFAQFSHLFESLLDIRKGFLALREGDQTRFLAIAGWKKDGPPRSLSLRLPQAPSFFEKVAEDGRLYSERVAEFFDGNTIERRLLFDDDTISFMLRPLKHDGQLVGILGYSSDVADAFVTAESGALDPAFDLLAMVMAHRQPVHAPA
jgi:hypothetical protein